MPWIVGIDEAGYGPNLGPLVMTSVACQVPEPLAGADLWKVLSAAVRRPDDPDDERLLVADSKQVYSTARGLHHLEAGVLSILSLDSAPTVGRLLDRLCPTAADELNSEIWYTGATMLPVEADDEAFVLSAKRFGLASQEGSIIWGAVQSVVMCPRRFNQIVNRWGSKGAVLAHGLAELLRGNLANGDGEPIRFLIDKHGGRNSYAAMLQDAVPDGFVVAHEESMERSIYSIRGQPRDVHFHIQPRADVEHFCVAFASMVSKYVRELLMREFNHFWQERVPGLKPTAGYPGDAARFFRAIRSAARRLKLPVESLWRER